MSDVKGLDEVLRKFRALPERIQKNVVVGAVRAGAKPIIKEAKARAPKGATGELAKSIGLVRRKEKDRSIIRFSITPRIKKPHGFLGHFKEFGTSKEPAHPFMRPAMDAKADETIRSATDYMAKRTEKEIKKL
jgi:HK97 gp10 family phage protein